MEIKHDLLKPSASLADVIRSKSRALTVRDVATYLSVSQRQVYKLAAEQCIPCFRIGSSIRFDPAAVASWLRRKMVSPPVTLLGRRTRT